MQRELLFELDDLLNIIGEKLQLTTTQFNRVETAYNNVANWLEQDEAFFKKFKPSIFPHGSFLLGTTIKPYNKEKEGKNEFDLDFINFLQFDYNSYLPKEVLDELEKRLKEHGTYKEKIERKNRCVRLNYEDETNPNNKFHIDIQPACPDNTNSNYWGENLNLRVPDKEQQAWKYSSPVPFASHVENKAKQVDRTKLLEKAKQQDKKWATKYYTDTILAQAPLPQSVPYQYKLPLLRAIQLIKRHRDVYFYNHELENFKTSSIILTTLTANSYVNEVSEFEIIKDFLRYTLNKLSTEGMNFSIANPLNNDEKFTDKWAESPQYNEAFVMFIRNFSTKCYLIDNNTGTKSNFSLLKEMLGEDIVGQSHQVEVDYIQQQRKNANLYVAASGIIGTENKANNIIIPKNNFYGT